MTKVRRPLLAAFLSLLTPGIGHLYNGRPKAAIAFFIVLAVLVACMGWLLQSDLIAQDYLGLVLAAVVVLLAVLTYLAAIGNAFRVARQSGEVQLQWFMRWYVYLGIFIAAFVLNELATPEKVSIRSYWMPATSMQPGLMKGDVLIAETGDFEDRLPKRGEVILYLLDPQTTFIKRVVGLPGDRVQMRDGVLFINGEKVARTKVGNQKITDAFGRDITVTVYEESLADSPDYLIVEISNSEPFDNTPVIEVPPGHLFVLGDNRDNSLDSRSPRHGTIPITDLSDKPRYIYWSRDLFRIGLHIGAE